MPLSKKEAFADHLKQSILTLEIAPGDVLDEQALAQEHGLSRTPLREVFQKLGGEGYIDLSENRSARVAPMDLVTMRHFFQTAPMVYAAVTRLAAEAATLPQIDRLEAIQANYRAAQVAGDVGQTVVHNHRFHEAIGTISGNPYLQASLGRLLIDHTRMSLTFYSPRNAADRERIDQAAIQHDQIIAAIAAREPARAVELTLAHWALSRDEIDRYVRPDPLSEVPGSTYSEVLTDAV